jgi:hypothetical protein
VTRGISVQHMGSGRCPLCQMLVPVVWDLHLQQLGTFPGSTVSCCQHPSLGISLCCLFLLPDQAQVMTLLSGGGKDCLEVAMTDTTPCFC